MSSLTQVKSAITSKGDLCLRLAGITNSDYHGLQGIFGASQLKEAMKSPAHFHAKHIARKIESVPSRSMLMGTISHSCNLENDLSTFIVGPDLNKNTKEWKNLVADAEASGKFLVTPDEHEDIVGRYNAFWSHGTLGALMDQRVGVEESWFTRDESGLYLKARTDVWGEGFILDYKTTSAGADSDSFSRTIANFGYDFSAAHYISVIESITGSPVNGYYLAVQETDAPYAIKVFQLSREAITRAETTRRRILTTLANCFMSGDFPGYTQEIEEIDVPFWAAKSEVV